MATKDEIIAGIISYTENEMLPKIKDNMLSIIIYFFISRLKGNNKLADVFFNNPLVKQLLTEENGEYDIDGFITSMKQSIQKFGGYISINIPAIPLLSPSEKELKFTTKDFDDLLKSVNNTATVEV